jgi:hypothetical protein
MVVEVNTNGRSTGIGGLGKNPPDEEDLRQFFGRNDTYYISQYQKISARDGAFPRALISWNWAAFLLSVPWYFYRRMATIGACLMFVPVVLWLISPRVAIIGTPFVFAMLAMVANYVYVTRSVEKVEEIYGDTISQMQREDAILRRGGTSWSAYAVAAFIVALGWGLVPRGEGEAQAQWMRMWQGDGVKLPTCAHDVVREQAGLLLRIAVRDRVPDKTTISRFSVSGYKNLSFDAAKVLRTCQATVTGPGVSWRYAFDLTRSGDKATPTKVANARPLE